MKNKRGQIQTAPTNTTQATTAVMTPQTSNAPKTQTTSAQSTETPKKSKLPIWIASGIVAIVAIIILIYFLFI